MLQFFARRKHILKSRLSNACVSVTVPCEKKKDKCNPGPAQSESTWYVRPAACLSLQRGLKTLVAVTQKKRDE